MAVLQAVAYLSGASVCLGITFVPRERLLTERLHRPGDYVIGGLFPVHYAVSEDRKTCTNFSTKGIAWLSAFLFAVDAINNSSDILPNVTLGYDIRDDCNQVDRSVEAAYDFISGRKFSGEKTCGPRCEAKNKPPKDRQSPETIRPQNCPEVRRRRKPSVISVVGSASSVVSGTVAHIFGVENVPQISYAATSRWLSNKEIYPSFLRTIPSDDLQVKVIVHLVNHFNWTYLSTLATDSVYGELGVQAFEDQIKKQKVCVAIRHVLPENRMEAAIGKFVTRLKESKEGKKSAVILGFLPEHEAPSLLKELTKHEVTDRTFVAAESWADSEATLQQPASLVEGTLGIISGSRELPAYSQYLQQVSLLDMAEKNFWLKQFIESELDCTFHIPGNRGDCAKMLKGSSGPMFRNILLSSRKLANVVDAVNAIAYALQELICSGKRCLKTPIDHAALLAKIKNIQFKGSKGVVSFDKNGDTEFNKYVIVNVQNEGGTLKYVDVGHWDGKLKINDSKIVWNGGSHGVPHSVCSQDCAAGNRILYGSSKCCWTCVLCDEGFFSNETNTPQCFSCKDTKGPEWTNNSRNTGCARLPVEYLRRNDDLAIAATVLSLSLFMLDVFCLGVFIRYRDTPVVKGSNKELSIALLVFLALCFLCPFLYIGKPSEMMCKVQPNVFGIVFTICISVMFTKTRRILTVFTARMSTLSAIHSERRRTEQKQVLLLITMTLVEASIVGMATYLMKPKLTFDYKNQRRVVLDCGLPSSVTHLIALSYTCFIAVICTFLAFKARKLPEAFNEARSISFTMFMMMLVWIGSIPAYLGSNGKQRTAWFCFSAMMAALPMLLFLIIPKVRIILFYPEKNRADVVRSQTTNHILTKAVRRTSSVSLANSGGSLSAQIRRRSNTAGSADSGTVMIHPRKQAKLKRQVSSTESQLTESRRFSDVSERSFATARDGQNQYPETIDMDTFDETLNSNDTRL